MRSLDTSRRRIYAESGDGVHWEKPRLGLVEFDGSKDNNLVWGGPGFDMAPFLDGNPDALEEERYKAVVDRGFVELLALASPDGLRWRLVQDEPILTERPFDTHNVPFWDPWRGEYVIYAQGRAERGGPDDAVRWVRRATSRDFRTWTPFEPIDTGGAPLEHLYTNACVPYERAPGTYLMFPSRIVPERSPDPEWPDPGVNDIVFMSSRDGLHFDRSFMEGFVRPGLDRGNWHERSLYMERGILRTSPAELSLYGMENSRLPSVRIRRFSLRTDGFVSMRAGYSGGEFTTQPLIFEGSELELNYSTSAAGALKVEVQDADGRPHIGLKEAACTEMFGDEIDRLVRWESDAGLGTLAGSPVKLRFTLKDADVYAFRFRKA